MDKSIFLNNISVHSDWDKFLNAEVINQLSVIKDLIDNDLDNNYNLLCPSPDKVLRFLEIPVKTIKVIILGQDPYPQKDTATGRAFEVNGLRSWTDSFRNPSLQNIIRAAYHAQTGDLIKFNEIRKKINLKFNIYSPPEIFNQWEKQGVLLLNKSLTCKLNTPGSHKDIWNKFTEELIDFINLNSPDAYWLIWGNHALEAIKHINPNNMVFSYHPSRCNKRENDFLYGENNCFKKTSEIINWLGYEDLPSIF